MRGDEQPAFVEFIERLRMVAWNHARDLGVPAAERRSWIEEILHDCALALVREGAQIPGNLAGYVVVSVRRKFFEQLRKTHTEQRVTDGLTQELTYLWSGSGSDVAITLPEPVVRLVDSISATLTEEEELLLIWKGHRITYSTIAEWLGEKRATVAQRIWRLTRRVSASTEQIIAPFSEEDRDVIRRFLHSREEDKSEKS
jgi:DNA-directed RNA polymerase specialized sigma24 family protein